MSLVLSYLPSPELREAMVLKAKRLLKPTQRHLSNKAPHDTGLLLIAEKCSIFNSGSTVDGINVENVENIPRHHRPLLSIWRNKICSLGFDIMKYRYLVPAQRSHVFAFRVSCSNVSRSKDADSVDDCSKMWIQQDFDAVSDRDEDEVQDLNKSMQSNLHRSRGPVSAKDLNLGSQGHGTVDDVLPVAIVGGGIGGAALALVKHLLFRSEN